MVKIFQYRDQRRSTSPVAPGSCYTNKASAVLQHSCDDHTLHGIFLPKDSYIRLKKVEKLQTLATSGHKKTTWFNINQILAQYWPNPLGGTFFPLHFAMRIRQTVATPEKKWGRSAACSFRMMGTDPMAQWPRPQDLCIGSLQPRKFQIFWLISIQFYSCRFINNFAKNAWLCELLVLKLLANSRGWTIIIQRMCVLRKHQTNIREALFFAHLNYQKFIEIPVPVASLLPSTKWGTTLVTAQILLLNWCWSRLELEAMVPPGIPVGYLSYRLNPSAKTLYIYIALYCRIYNICIYIYIICIYIYIYINHHHMLYGLYTSHTCVYNSCRNNSCLKSSAPLVLAAWEINKSLVVMGFHPLCVIV